MIRVSVRMYGLPSTVQRPDTSPATSVRANRECGLKEKNMKAYTFNPPKNNLLQIDIIIEESLKFGSMEKAKVLKSIEGVKIPVIAITDLLKMKKKSGRTNDLQDIQALLKLKSL